VKDGLANCVKQKRVPEKTERICGADIERAKDTLKNFAKENMVVAGTVEDSSGKAKAGTTEPSGEKTEENAAEPSEARAEEKTPKVSGVKV